MKSLNTHNFCIQNQISILSEVSKSWSYYEFKEMSFNVDLDDPILDHHVN